MNAPVSPAITRPMLRWHGGKWKLAPWIISFFPKHRIYTEIYGGAGSVLLRKAPSYCDVWNDLDDAVWNLMRVLREGRGPELVEQLKLTAFARREFELSYEPADDPLESARRLIVRSYMGFGSDAHNAAVVTGFRSNSNRSGTTPARDWANFPTALAAISRRIHDDGVVIEHRPALEVLAAHDDPNALHYVDPPYLPDTRSPKSRRSGEKYHAYAHEMTEADHEEMLAALRAVEGMVILSGYPSDLYEHALEGWHRVEKAAHADGARKRTEVLYLNPAAAAASPQGRLL